MAGTKPAHNQFSTLFFLGLASISRVFTGWYYSRNNDPTAIVTDNAARPIFEQALLAPSPDAPEIKATAEVTDSGLLPRIASAAWSVLGFSWSTIGLAGVALGGLSLLHRYWKGNGAANNTNVNINIHFTGMPPAVVEKNKDGTTLNVNMAPPLPVVPSQVPVNEASAPAA